LERRWLRLVHGFATGLICYDARMR
jgi:hypothetical protein